MIYKYTYDDGIILIKPAQLIVTPSAPDTLNNTFVPEIVYATVHVSESANDSVIVLDI